METSKTQNICWKTAATIATVFHEELKTAVDGYWKTKHAINVKEIDVTGDGLPDRFVLLESPKNYLVVLLQGNIHTEWAGKFDQIPVNYFGYSSKAELVGAIAKMDPETGGKTILKTLDWQVDVKGEKPQVNILARGYSANFPNYFWEFTRDNSCNRKSLSYDPTKPVPKEPILGGPGTCRK